MPSQVAELKAQKKNETRKTREGMGAIPHEGGVAFRVWAPHSDRVFVTGEFNGWADDATPMVSEGNGFWYADSSDASVGDEYRYILHNGSQPFSRIDPYAREVTNSVGNAVVHDPEFDWDGDAFQPPAINEMVIYELHIGTFNDEPGAAPGTFAGALERLEHLVSLGVNVIEVMPAAEFAGDYSWGYNPAHIFAIESAYGGPKAFKQFVKRAHQLGIAVVVDVVYTQFGPWDLDVGHFDGWRENGGGGIYFYNDWRAETPWGNSRPDYGRSEVRQYIFDNALMWLEDYHVDGLRFDMSLYVRQVRATGEPGSDLPDGWSLMQWINREIRSRFPGKITIAEDLQDNAWLTKDNGAGGAGFSAQWDAGFVHPTRAIVTECNDENRSMLAARDAVCHNFNGNAFERVIYSESHDEVANGKSRVPSEIDPEKSSDWYAKKRSTLAAGLVFTSPGIPMIFQGQEFLQDGWFQDTVPLDWNLSKRNEGLVKLYRDLISLRRNKAGTTRGLCGGGVNVRHVNDAEKVIVVHRFDKGGPGDDVIVVANFSGQSLEGYQIGVPAPGAWKLRLNSDWNGYDQEFRNFQSGDVIGEPGEYDGCPCHAQVAIGPYSLLIFSQEKE